MGGAATPRQGGMTSPTRSVGIGSGLWVGAGDAATESHPAFDRAAGVRAAVGMSDLFALEPVGVLAQAVAG